MPCQIKLLYSKISRVVVVVEEWHAQRRRHAEVLHPPLPLRRLHLTSRSAPPTAKPSVASSASAAASTSPDASVSAITSEKRRIHRRSPDSATISTDQATRLPDSSLETACTAIRLGPPDPAAPRKFGRGRTRSASRSSTTVLGATSESEQRPCRSGSPPPHPIAPKPRCSAKSATPLEKGPTTALLVATWVQPPISAAVRQRAPREGAGRRRKCRRPMAVAPHFHPSQNKYISRFRWSK